MKIGFSGSRTGMSFKQSREFSEWVEENKDLITEFHHGMCVGADTDAHGIVRDITQTGQPGSRVTIHGHPGFKSGHPTRGLHDNQVDTLYGVMDPLIRNHRIADECDLMIFAPLFPETRRSGTWATFRYCRKKKYKVLILARGTFQNPEGDK